jgi:hypothetical protein
MPSEESSVEVYAPIEVLKPVAKDIWIVDGPVIEFGRAGLAFPFTTRMTVVKLASGDLLLHSPITYSKQLHGELLAIGPIRYLLAPNSLHYWWLADWKARAPKAIAVTVPGLAQRARRHIQPDLVLSPGVVPWPDDFDMIVVAGDGLTEAVLFHRASKTLVLTDLIENFELKKVRRWFYRQLIRIGGAADPDGKAPIDLRFAFFRHRRALRADIREMIEWAPERVILAHGRWYETNGVAELKRAFRWVL